MIAELRELRAWKKSAIAHTPDFQEIGKLLGVAWGDSVHDKIIPSIRELRERADEFRLWAYCGGVPCGRVCSSPKKPGHKIFGPHVGIGEDKYECEFHYYTRRMEEAEAQRDELSKALQWAFGFIRKPDPTQNSEEYIAKYQKVEALARLGKET